MPTTTAAPSDGPAVSLLVAGVGNTLVSIVRFRAGLVAVATVIALTVRAESSTAEVPQPLDSGGMARVVEIVDGDTVVLDDDRQVRLVGIQAPKLPLGRKGFAEWPLAGEAKAALAAMVRGKTVELGYGGRRTDRHRRALAHLFLEDGTWVQGRLLEAGMARVYTFPDNRALADALYAAERAARAAERGIWSDRFYAIRSPDRLGGDFGTFQVVEGRVLRAEQVRSRVYLNFTEDWRTDFTIVVATSDIEMFRAAGLDPLALAGRIVRVRGWLRKWNGPMIEATHPEQIELPESE